MATEADLIQKFKDLKIPVGSDFEELIHEAFIGANLVDKVDNYGSRIDTVEDNLEATKGSIKLNANQLANKADDSKVLHSTVTTLKSTDMNTVLTAGFYRLSSGTNGIPNGDAWIIYQVISLSDVNGIQLAYGTNNAILGMRSWNSSGGNSHFTSWVQFADDSKVAHLSGANNFDTVPTVNNNPLLLASSLPSDLARTTKDTNFTGKLQKSGIDVATKSDVTTAVNSATANMVSPNMPTNFTAGLKSGGVDVATAADIKSIEDQAWYTVTGKNNTFSDYTLMYKINDAEKYMDLIFYGTMGISISPDLTKYEVVDLSTIIKNPKDVSGGLIALETAASGGGLAGAVLISGTKIVFSWRYNNTSLLAGKDLMSYGISTKAPFLRVTFD